MLVGAHDGAVNHRILVVGVGGQVLEEALPYSFVGPTAEPLVGVLPIAKPLRQVAPRNSGAVTVEHRFDESAIVVGGDADITGFAGQQVLDSLPSGYRLGDALQLDGAEIAVLERLIV